MSKHDVTCRFERMIIALSTHALFSNTAESLNDIASDASAALVSARRNFLFGLTDVFSVSCRPSLERMFPWKQQFEALVGHGNDLPLYSSSARRIRNIQRLVVMLLGST
jgi:hypothetical protein